MTDAERLAAVRVYVGSGDEADGMMVRHWAAHRYGVELDADTAAFWLLSKAAEGKAKARYRDLEHFLEVARAERRRGRLG